MTPRHATGCREDLKRLTSELPTPGSVRGTPERHGVNGFVKCVFVTNCIVIVLSYHCKTVLLYRSTLYTKNVIRGETRMPVPDICVLRFCVVNVILRRINVASYR
jgi:hypothetical protein